MKIVKNALAGTLESSDLLVKVAPAPGDGLEVVISSEVMHQFGVQIDSVVRETLRHLGVANGQIVVEDKGALDCVIRARVQTAVLRGAECAAVDWSLVS